MSAAIIHSPPPAPPRDLAAIAAEYDAINTLLDALLISLRALNRWRHGLEISVHDVVAIHAGESILD